MRNPMMVTLTWWRPLCATLSNKRRRCRRNANVATLVLSLSFVLELPLPLSFATFVGILVSFGIELAG
jgi:hypothetical protein